MSLLKELAALNEPAPEFNPDQDGLQDVTLARVSGFDAEPREEGALLSAAPTRPSLRTRNAPNLADIDPKYAGEQTSRHKVFPNRQSNIDLNDLHDLTLHDGSLQSSKDNKSDESSNDEEEGNDISDDDNQSSDAAISDAEQLPDNTGQVTDVPLLALHNQAQQQAQLHKAAAVRAQQQGWERLLCVRMQLQKVLKLAVQLPRPQTLLQPTDIDTAHDTTRVKLLNSGWLTHGSVQRVMGSLLELEGCMAEQQSVAGKEKDDDEITSSEDEPEQNEMDDAEEVAEVPSKRASKRGASVVSDVRSCALFEASMAKRANQTVQFRDQTLKKWDEKTRPVVLAHKKKHTEPDILTQLQQILSDEQRLVQRTRILRSDTARIGAKKTEDGLDAEHFNDDDFYQQLLKQLIERKSTGTGTSDLGEHYDMNRQYVELQRLRQRANRHKKVDTKASKARKIRYEVYSKLLHYMAPQTHTDTWNTRATDDLFTSLFTNS